VDSWISNLPTKQTNSYEQVTNNGNIVRRTAAGVLMRISFVTAPADGGTNILFYREEGVKWTRSNFSHGSKRPGTCCCSFGSNGGRTRWLKAPIVISRSTCRSEIFEADFEDGAYGYPPGRSAADAIREVHRLICRGYTDVIDADLSKYLRHAYRLARAYAGAPGVGGMTFSQIDSRSARDAGSSVAGNEIRSNR
jgi:hypothetical protein